MEDIKKTNKHKRSNGEGSVYKNKTGGYTGAISYKDETGKRKRKTFDCKTKKEVLAKMAEFKNQNYGKHYISSKQNITVKEWLDIWFNEYSINSIKLSTRVTYESYMKNHINPAIGNIKLVDLRGDIVQSFYNEKMRNGNLRREGGMKPKTIKNIHNMLHKAFEQAVKNDILIKNPLDAVVLSQVEKKEVKVLTVEEQRRLLKAVSSERLGIAVFIALATGMRIGEITGLQNSDIDLDKKKISVKYSLNRLKSYNPDAENKTELVLGSAKTKYSIRRLDISKELMEKIIEYKKIVESEKEFFGAEYSDRGFFICNEIGSPIEPRYYQKWFKEFLKRVGIEGVGFHSLRHTFSTRALEAKVSMKTVSEILGHSSISITMDLYSHVLEDQAREDMQVISTKFLTVDKDE